MLRVDGEETTGDFLLVEVLNIQSVGPNLVLSSDADPVRRVLRRRDRGRGSARRARCTTSRSASRGARACLSLPVAPRASSRHPRRGRRARRRRSRTLCDCREPSRCTLRWRRSNCWCARQSQSAPLLRRLSNVVSRGRQLVAVAASRDPPAHRRRSDPAFLAFHLLAGVLADGCGVFDLRVHHRPEEKHETRHVEPQEQHHRAAERTIRLGVVRHVDDVVPEAKGGGEPEQRGERRCQARARTTPARRPARSSRPARCRCWPVRRRAATPECARSTRARIRDRARVRADRRVVARQSPERTTRARRCATPNVSAIAIKRTFHHDRPSSTP